MKCKNLYVAILEHQFYSLYFTFVLYNEKVITLNQFTIVTGWVVPIYEFIIRFYKNYKNQKELVWGVGNSN